MIYQGMSFYAIFAMENNLRKIQIAGVDRRTLSVMYEDGSFEPLAVLRQKKLYVENPSVLKPLFDTENEYKLFYAANQQLCVTIEKIHRIKKTITLRNLGTNSCYEYPLQNFFNGAFSSTPMYITNISKLANVRC